MNSIVNLTELQRPGGKRLPVAEFLRGHPLQAGQVLVNSQGTPGAGYSLWRTPMLQPASWTVVTNGIADGTGRVTLTDPAPPATGSFYRTSAP